MSRDKDRYEVGYGKPPQHSQFKANGAQPTGRSRSRRKLGPLNIGRILNERIAVKKNGVPATMPAFEVSLRALIVRAVKNKCLSSYLKVMALAREFGLIAPPPEPPQLSSVVGIKTDCPVDEYRRIADPDTPREEKELLLRKWGKFHMVGEDFDRRR